MRIDRATLFRLPFYKSQGELMAEIKSESRTFWFGWGMALGGLLGAFFAVTIVITFFRAEGRCLANTQEICSREWFAAFGNWAGFIVTVPSVFLLWHQIRVGQKQHLRSLNVGLSNTASRITQLGFAVENLEWFAGQGNHELSLSDPDAKAIGRILNEIKHSIDTSDTILKSDANFIMGLMSFDELKTNIGEVLYAIERNNKFERNYHPFTLLPDIFKMSVDAAVEINIIRNLAKDQLKHYLM